MHRAVIAALLLFAGLPAGATEAGWALLRNGGQVVLISHADAPGSGDPANFDVEDCATQRNLSSRGQQQARRMGALFFARAAPIERVLTSRYCRARDTARLAFGDSDLEVLDALDPPADGEAGEDKELQALAKRILDYSGAGNLLMVTHPSTVAALTGARARPGEAVILSRSQEGIGVAARISFN